MKNLYMLLPDFIILHFKENAAFDEIVDLIEDGQLVSADLLFSALADRNKLARKDVGEITFNDIRKAQQFYRKFRIKRRYLWALLDAYLIQLENEGKF